MTSAAQATQARISEWPPIAILPVAWLLRWGVALLWPNIQWPDEIYQVLEPAHRIVFGYGLLSWEWHAGIRSLVLPGAFAGVLEIAKWLGLGPGFYLPLIEALLCALSLTVVWVAYRLGRDPGFGVGTRWGAMAAAAPAALWFELVLFAPHALADAIAAHVMVPGLYLLQSGVMIASGEAPRRKRDAASGALLALAAALRPNLALPLFLGAVTVLRGQRARWGFLAAGALPMLIAYGAVDLLQGQWPFESTIRFLDANLLEGNSTAFGVAPWYAYAALFVVHWGIALPFLVLLLYFGLRGNSLWLIVAAALVIEQSILPHKEYRFVYPAIVCLMPVIGIGAARLAAWSISARARHNPGAIALCMIWLAAGICSAALARQTPFAAEWTRGAASIRAFAALRADPSVCGIGVLPGTTLAYLPGYVSLHRSVPLQDDIVDPASAASWASDLLTPAPRDRLPPGFALDRCWSGTSIGFGGAPNLCRYHRTGGCVPLR